VRILFSGVPAFGHLLPFAPLARAARAAGHDVALLTSGGMAPALAADLPGVPVLPAGPMPDVLFAEVGRRTGVADAAGEPDPQAVAEFFAGARVDLTADEALTAARDWAPDLMVCEATDFVGPLVAADLGVPWHVLAVGPGVPPEFTAPMTALVAPRYADRGVTPTAPASYVDPVPAALQTPGFEPPARRLPVRAEAHQRPGSPAPADTVRAGRPRVLVTLGTVFTEGDLLAGIVGALDTEQVDVVATLGVIGLTAPETPGVTYRTFAPLAELLAGVDVVVCAGGSGTMLGALSRGVPLVVLPQGADQPLNAARAQAAGVAVVVSDPREAGAATRLVLADPSYGTAAAGLAREIAAQPSPADVVATLTADRATAGAPAGR
jgi:UDP:flavonoid glycosyltransferase YjiC (YdhE family)